jgi:Fe-S-cluster-containing dehydrogenase component/DMSO reductase anchor subunit
MSAALLEPQSPAPTGSNLLDELLRDQQRLTAVEQFAQQHECGSLPAQSRYYRDLIPLSAPQPGEQYAFEVDLDACSGCKACVVACHNLNGLEEDETWRSVGLLSGGSAELPVVQHVTSACHHCLEPACLHGCPVNAYVKDETTGIVKHLDDQCIGCQYCILKCPYDVPKYSSSRGIVRKCDMCQDRLAAGEAPACVQSCPNMAIRIRLVSKQTIIEESESNQFLPGAAAPSYTLPTTTFKTRRALPRNLLPADYYAAAPQHAHWPLVLMLVLTQMSVGAFVVEQLLGRIVTASAQEAVEQTRAVHLVAAFALGMLGLAASLFHLGRPLYAFRAVIGLLTSWLSREILCFGAFALFASLYAALPWANSIGIQISARASDVLGWGVVASGLAGVFCSVMVYDSTRRPLWHWSRTGLRFLLTGAVLGIPTSLLIAFAAAATTDSLTVRQIMRDYGNSFCGVLAIIAAGKLLFEASLFIHLGSRRLTPMRRTAMLAAGELGQKTAQRFLCGLLGGIVLPGMLYLSPLMSPGQESSTQFTAATVIASLVLSLLGEILERYLYFSAVIAPKMPGTAA